MMLNQLLVQGEKYTKACRAVTEFMEDEERFSETCSVFRYGASESELYLIDIAQLLDKCKVEFEEFARLVQSRGRIDLVEESIGILQRHNRLSLQTKKRFRNSLCATVGGVCLAVLAFTYPPAAGVLTSLLGNHGMLAACGGVLATGLSGVCTVRAAIDAESEQGRFEVCSNLCTQIASVKRFDDLGDEHSVSKIEFIQSKMNQAERALGRIEKAVGNYNSNEISRSLREIKSDIEEAKKHFNKLTSEIFKNIPKTRRNSDSYM